MSLQICPRAPRWSSCLWTPATGWMMRIAPPCTMPSANQTAISKLAVSSAPKTSCANFAPREASTGPVRRHGTPPRPSRAPLVGDQPREPRGVCVGSRSRPRLDRHTPGVGSSYPRVPGMRRIFLERVAVHVYFTFDGDRVIVRAVWGARRRRGGNRASDAIRRRDRDPKGPRGCAIHRTRGMDRARHRAKFSDSAGDPPSAMELWPRAPSFHHSAAPSGDSRAA